jgi:hypothetical protein
VEQPIVVFAKAIPVADDHLELHLPAFGPGEAFLLRVGPVRGE